MVNKLSDRRTHFVFGYLIWFGIYNWTDLLPLKHRCQYQLCRNGFEDQRFLLGPGFL